MGRGKRIGQGVLAICVLSGWAGTSFAAEPGRRLGLNVDVELASTYLFRGLNLYRDADQPELRQYPRVSPGVSWKIFDSGISVSYWSAYQLAGANIAANNDKGAGTEQDLTATYERALTPALSLSVALVSYLYPVGKKAAAKVDFPVWLDPTVGVRYAGPVELSLKVSTMFGLASELADDTYVYFNPTVGKNLPLWGDVELALSLGFGFKVFTSGDLEGRDNRFDLLLSASSVIPVWENVYVKPALLLSWTDRRDLGLGDELGFSGGVNVGADF